MGLCPALLSNSFRKSLPTRQISDRPLAFLPSTLTSRATGGLVLLLAPPAGYAYEGLKPRREERSSSLRMRSLQAAPGKYEPAQSTLVRVDGKKCQRAIAY